MPVVPPITIACLHYSREDLVPPVTIASLHYSREDLVLVPVTIACLHYGREDLVPVTIACLYNMGNCVILLALICPTSSLGEDLVPHCAISLLGIFFI